MNNFPIKGDELNRLICCLMKAEADGSDEEVEFWRKEIEKEKSQEKNNVN